MFLWLILGKAINVLLSCLSPVLRGEKNGIEALMDNLHVRLTFNLGKTNKMFYYS